MAGTIVTDRIESDASYASSITVASPLVVSNTFAIPSGSASAPAISPTGDTNTGIFFPAADTIAFSEGGVEGVRIDSSGNLGIGTTSPAAKLNTSIASGTNITHLLLTETGTTSNSEILIRANNSTQNWNMGAIGFLREGGSDNFALRFFTGSGPTNTERMRVDSAGRVTQPFQPMCSVYSSDEDGFTGSNGTVVPFDQEQVDVGSNYNTSTYRFTAPVAGKYFATVWFLVRITTSGACIGLCKNGSQIRGRGGYSDPGSGNEIQALQTLIIDCAANDYIDARITQSVTGAGDFYLGDLAGMQVYLIG
jgi:hypothetical protein